MQKVEGVTKYGPLGDFNELAFANLRIGSPIKQTLITCANKSVAKKTWGVYESASQILDECRKDNIGDI